MYHEDWFPTESQKVLRNLASRVSHLSGRVVEIGSWEGRSTAVLANTVHPDRVHAVDTWLGSPGEPSARIALTRDVFSIFLGNMAEYTAGNVDPYRMDWRDYVQTVDGPVKFLHIDAWHTFSEVHDTLEAFVPLMTDGGVICGDDAHHPPVLQAVLTQFAPEEIWRDASEWWVQL